MVLISLLLPSASLSRPLSLLAAELRAWKLFGAMRYPASASYHASLPPLLQPFDTVPPSHISSDNRRINHLIRSGLLIRAHQVFDEMPDRDVVSWNSIIAGYARANSPQQAINLFKEMLASGIKETTHTYSSLLGACSSHRQGLQLHCRAVSLGLDSNLFAGSALINLYMRAGSPDIALIVFHRLPQRSTASCNSILRGFCDLRLADEMLTFFLREMRLENGIEPDGVSFSYLIRGCCSRTWLDEGKQLHCLVIKYGWVPANLFLSNVLVDLYAAAGELIDARRSSDCIPLEDVISWNSMVSVCADNGSTVEALGFFHKMLWQGMRPSVRLFVGLLNLSSRSRHLPLGAQIHGFALKAGFSSGSPYVQSALIDMYGKCQKIENSVLLFNEITERCLECCNSLITSFLHCNLLEDAVEMFGLMLDEGVTPDHVTFSAALRALSSSSDCQLLHCCALKSGVESNKMVSCSLISAYARCGHGDLSRRIFERIEEPNLICFTAMITAYARNGMGREAVEMLDEMIRKGLKPDGVTFVCVLAGCDHSGLVVEGRAVFDSMRAVHGVEPDSRHYSCMVNLLGRAGLVEEAMELARVHSEPRVWTSLLHSCRAHGNEEVGRTAAEMLMELEAGDAAACLQVSSFYAEMNDPDRSAQLREMLPDFLGREVGCSFVEVRGVAHL